MPVIYTRKECILTPREHFSEENHSKKIWSLKRYTAAAGSESPKEKRKRWGSAAPGGWCTTLRSPAIHVLMYTFLPEAENLSVWLDSNSVLTAMLSFRRWKNKPRGESAHAGVCLLCSLITYAANQNPVIRELLTRSSFARRSRSEGSGRTKLFSTSFPAVSARAIS
jgi:hypothetical protein